ncbi:hydrogenase/urease maturation nickel metallochaperone HypA [Varibaculum cambriense]|nr:hydrogenase/urease maturation nickel metallochaperone HypA [Varibaculum cambriense]
MVCCRECKATTELREVLDFRCQECSSRDLQIISGEEFRVVSIEVTPLRKE